MKKLKWMFKALKALVTVACVVLFFVLMARVWEKFSNGTTNTGTKMRYHDETTKQLPSVTVCPVGSLKELGSILWISFGRNLHTGGQIIDSGKYKCLNIRISCLLD
jgi:hypothetical protein